MEGIPFKRLYLDSTNRVSGSHDDFEFEFSETLTFGKNVVACIEGFSCPMSWYSVEDGVNDQFYWYERYSLSQTTPVIQNWLHKTTIPEGFYNAISLGQAMASAMQNESRQYVSSTTGSSFQFNSAYNAQKNAITITLTAVAQGTAPTTYLASFEILTDSILGDLAWYTLAHDNSIQPPWFDNVATSGTIPTWSLTAPQSINNIIGLDLQNLTSDVVEAFTRLQGGLTLGITHDTGYCDMRRIHQIMLHSSAFKFNSLAHNGVQTILKRIPVSNVTAGDMIYHDHSGNQFDHFDVSSLSLRRVRFTIKDSSGKRIRLNGGNISFSITVFEAPL